MAKKQQNSKQNDATQLNAAAGTAETFENETLPNPQTDPDAQGGAEESSSGLVSDEANPQTDPDTQGGTEEFCSGLVSDEANPQTDSDAQGGAEEFCSGLVSDGANPQTETKKEFASTPEDERYDTPPDSEDIWSEKPAAVRRKKKAESTQFDMEREVGRGESEDAEEMRTEPSSRSRSTKKPNVLTIDGERSVETEADKAKNDLIDLTESLKTGKILSGTIQGVERPNNRANAFAVIYHGAFKVIVPAEEAVELPEDLRDQTPEDVFHYLLTKRLGAEVDYIVKGVDAKAGIAVASRLDAMRIKRREYYFGSDRDGNNLIYPGLCAEARVVSVIRAGIFVDLFGLEVYIPLRELSYQRIMDAAGYFQPGQRILVKVTDVDRSNRNRVKAAASVKQAAENPYEKALRMYAEGNRYVGTVSMVDTNGVFVALDGGIDCLCSYPKRGRPPRGARVTVRILGINRESNRIWGAITHIAVPR